VSGTLNALFAGGLVRPSKVANRARRRTAGTGTVASS
jgi:hypothetical protein